MKQKFLSLRKSSSKWEMHLLDDLPTVGLYDTVLSVCNGEQEVEFPPLQGKGLQSTEPALKALKKLSEHQLCTSCDTVSYFLRIEEPEKVADTWCKIIPEGSSEQVIAQYRISSNFPESDHYIFKILEELSSDRHQEAIDYWCELSIGRESAAEILYKLFKIPIFTLVYEAALPLYCQSIKDYIQGEAGATKPDKKLFEQLVLKEINLLTVPDVVRVSLYKNLLDGVSVIQKRKFDDFPSVPAGTQVYLLNNCPEQERVIRAALNNLFIQVNYYMEYAKHHGEYKVLRQDIYDLESRVFQVYKEYQRTKDLGLLSSNLTALRETYKPKLEKFYSISEIFRHILQCLADLIHAVSNALLKAFGGKRRVCFFQDSARQQRLDALNQCSVACA